MTNREQTIQRLLNGETDVQVRCALELGYNAGYEAALKTLESKAHSIMSLVAKHDMPYIQKRLAVGLSLDTTGMTTRLVAEIEKLSRREGGESTDGDTSR
jgi:hypothetical protein